MRCWENSIRNELPYKNEKQLVPQTARLEQKCMALKHHSDLSKWYAPSMRRATINDNAEIIVPKTQSRNCAFKKNKNIKEFPTEGVRAAYIKIYI